jgi:asparagine N-glycosylation enzyme membrane subunit Stt3
MECVCEAISCNFNCDFSWMHYSFSCCFYSLQFTCYWWVKAVKTGLISWAALSYFYMVTAWDGYVFIINLIPLHVFVLQIMNRYSLILFSRYTTFFILTLIFSMQISFVVFEPVNICQPQEFLHFSSLLPFWNIYKQY